MVFACIPGGGAPQVVPRGTLQPEGEAAGKGEKGPFAVISASPEGETRDVPEISITFNRAMRALDGSPPAAPVRLTPSVAGTWDWVGTRALRFSPEKPLPMATEFTVEVAGARSIDGSTLEKPHRFSFSTPRPRLTGASPHAGTRGQLPDAVVKLEFNQPVDDAAVRASVRLQKVGGGPVDFELKRPDGGDRRRVHLVPRAPLAVHSNFRVTIEAGLRGTEGPLEAGKEHTWDFSTYGPLEATFECGTDVNRRCRPGAWMDLRLENPVRRSDLRKALQIEPPVKMAWPSWENDRETTTVLPLSGAFLPGKSYTVRLKTQAGKTALKDVHGQPLKSELVQRIEMGDLPPNFNIGVSGELIEPSEQREIPFFSMNLDQAEVATAPLDLASVLSLQSMQDAQGVDLVFASAKAKKTTLRSAGKNRVSRQGVKLADLLPNGRGPAAVAARFTVNGHERTQLKVVQVTDLALSAKLSGQESLVWVTRLSTGLPVEGATVEVYRNGEAKPSATVKADSQGLARVPAGLFEATPGGDGESRVEALIVARDGNDWAFRGAEDELNGWRYGAVPESSTRPPELGLLFTERGLYRPGESVKLKGIVRLGTTKGMATPAGKKVQVKVTGPEGDKVGEFEATLSAFGSFSHEVQLPPGSKLGSYRARAALGEKKAAPAPQPGQSHDEDEPEEHGGWSASFSVAEFRPAEFKAAADLDRTAYQRGDEVRCGGSGTYLFGAPMAGSTAQLSLTHNAAYFSPPGLDGFTVDDGAYQSGKPEAAARGGQLQGAAAKLDGQGAASIKAKLDLPGQTGPEVVTCEAEITDLSRQSFSGTATALVHPGEVYAAQRLPQGLFVDAGATLRPEALAVQPDGKRRAGVPLVIELFERSYGVNRQAGGDSELHTSVTITDRSVASCKVTSGAGPAGCELKVPAGGHYLLRTTATDGRGNKVSSSSNVYAIGSGGGGGGWGDHDDGSLKLVLDKKTYQAGDTARVLIQSPFPEGEALVTVEREGVLWQKVMKVSGATPTVQIPVTEAQMPNAYVSVLLLRGRTKKSPGDDKAPDVGAPAFRVGYAPLVVDTSSRRLKVEVKPARAELHPGDELSVDLSVSDAAGKGARAEVALYAVDEGVLALTGYRTPDPVSTFFAARGIQVHTVEAREALARIARRDSGVALGLDKGLDGGGGGLDARRDFRQTAYFNPSIVTDDAGHARASFKLPDGLTTYRLMAVAASAADHFGAAEAQVITSKPIMARPALPRVLRAGDRFEAGAVITSKGASGRFEVGFTADGLAVEGEPRKTIELSPGQSQEVRFVTGAPRAGKAKLRFDVKGEGVSDSVEVTREVLTPTTVEAAALYGDTEGATGERLGDLKALRDDVGGLEVSLSSTALAGLAGGVEQLIEYPYGCTEQLTSRLVPLLPLRDLAAALGLKLPEKVDEAVRATVGKVLNNQHSNGGFGLWPESEHEQPWLTAYALWGLGEAQRRGIPVRASALTAATRYLRSSLGHAVAQPHDLAERAFVLDVLAESGEPDAGAAGTLFEQREKMPLFGKAQLLHALALAKADPSLIQKLTTEVEQSLRYDGPRASVSLPETDEFSGLLDSPTRTSALVLRALVTANPAHPAGPKLALGLLHSRRGGRWRSTQETAWALLALDAYRRAQEAVSPSFQARVFLGQALLADTTFQGHERLAFQSSTPMSALQASSGEVLAFEKKGQGHLFYEARLRFARRQMPQHPIESGFFVDKGSRVVTPQSLRDALSSGARGVVSSLSAGDLVLVNLTVVAPSEREFVVIDDPLPAGLEAVNTSLEGTSSWAREGDEAPEVNDDDDDGRRWRWEAPVTRRELRDDRVVFFIDSMEPGVHRFRYLARATSIGTFLAPPTRVEEMYTPETFGQTAGSTLTIAPKP